MKYLRVISTQTKPAGQYGLLHEKNIHLIETSPLWGPIKETGIVFPLDEILKFLPPVEPPNIIGIALNYHDSLKKSGIEPPPEPVVFLKATSSTVGHLRPVVLPAEAPDMIDYEAELAVVIGKKCRRVSENEAPSYIFGYTCVNDLGAQDCLQKRDRQWARGKSFDTFTPVGPVIETDLEASDLQVQFRLNGETMQNGNVRNMVFSIDYLVSYLSRQMTLLPGTLILTGSPAGTGSQSTPPVFLKPNDRMEVEIAGIGVLANPVVAEMPRTK
jgi:2-keto-4-pentenoate hydratase/2-oxohepta-3-ene-1,7-dioic acid hydratase in catechol pathway